MSLSTWKIATVVVLAAGALFTAFLAVSGGEDEQVHYVAEVRHPEVGGIPHKPAERTQDDTGRTMVASYYGRELEGEPMASGEPFDADAYTAAHKSLPFGTKLGVAYGGEFVRVTVTDRGPYAAGRDLDLSLAAAREIGLTASGEAPVRVTRP
ncbi:MAG: septal ring lytic transglycosylase RlpA family protein [Actinomycetota bacterium]|nr:septal ring lytic transglycosylase RlpA family protein [Actinomycetota bacterium]